MKFRCIAGRRIARSDVSSGNVYFYFADQVGSPRAVTQADGTVCFSADYYPYGQELNFANSCPQNYKFTGYERDSETGLDYAFARYYNSRMGRFMSADPLSGAIGAPQSHNRYSYVVNNPHNLVDPSGLMSCRIASLCPLSGYGGGAGIPDTGGLDEFALMQIPVIVVYGVFYVNVGPGVVAGYPDGYQGEAILAGYGGNGADLLDIPRPSSGPTAAGDMCRNQPALVKPSTDVNYQINSHVDYTVRMELTPEVAQALDSAIGAMNGLGIVPMFNDGYRTAGDQAQRVAGGSGRNAVDAVGHSPHQAAQAVDINGTRSPEFATISTIMKIFGFKRYNPPEDDPPHFQMTSGDRAKQIQLAANSRTCGLSARWR